MNTFFFFPFLLIVVLVVALMLLLPFWLKGRFSGYLKLYDANLIYAVILFVFGLILSPISLLGWAISFFDLMQTTPAFDPLDVRLHDWAFSLYGQLLFLRWPSMVMVFVLFGAGIYFLFTGGKKTKEKS